MPPASRSGSCPLAAAAATSSARSAIAPSTPLTIAWCKMPTRTNAAIRSAAPTTAPAVTAVRTRRVENQNRRRSLLRTISVQPVADPAHSTDRVATERNVDLAPQVADVDLDDVRRVIEREVPYVVEELPLRQRLAFG